MATRYYGISRGEDIVTVAASTTSKNFELAVDDAASATKKDIEIALIRLSKAVSEDEGFTDS